MQWERPHTLFARRALTSQGWQRDVLVAIDSTGAIARISANARDLPAGTLSCDLLLPGMGNVHSHSFQRAMVGLTEVASGAGHDNFWSWRRVMYAFMQQLTPEQIEIISRALYIDLLKNGYTAVGEFHYLHHDERGRPYANSTELSDRIVAAAGDSGIHLTHLPVMYETGNFGGVAANDGQKRFLHTAESYLALLGALQKNYGDHSDMVLGIAPHSLRAVTPESLRMIITALPSLGLGDCPIHMHIAEQEKEVADCMAWSGKRPMEWLLGHEDVNARWCLVHATHMTPEETARLAASGATAGLCPMTEANLGDGIFPAEQYLQAGGSFGVGTDSQVCLSPWEELRQLEYAQRLLTRRRAVLFDEATPSVGRTLFERAAAGGAKALGLRSGKMAEGLRADLLLLSTEDAFLADKDADQLLDTLIFGGIRPCITDVIAGGRRVITDGKHQAEEASAKAMRQVMRELES